MEILQQEEVGAFVVRDSSTHPGCYALSVRVPRFENASGISHYLIMRTQRGVKLKVREGEREEREREREKERDRQTGRHKKRERERERGRDRQPERERESGRERERERERKREIDRQADIKRENGRERDMPVLFCAYEIHAEVIPFLKKNSSPTVNKMTQLR